MLRTIIIPHTSQDLLIQLPESFLNTEIEIIAFPVQEHKNGEMVPKKSYEDAVDFYKKYAVDFTQVAKWKRENLYE